jgi:hypothetical protein
MEHFLKQEKEMRTYNAILALPSTGQLKENGAVQ